MDEYGFTPECITRNGAPWFPLMGEFHYSRYPAEYWKESLYKMKAGGIDVVSTYVIWIHHEEIEGEYDFSGRRDLSRFVRTCAECGLKAMLRIGPWCHGEVRNGGFPDWLLEKPFKARTNDEGYFAAVEKWYRAVFERVEGLFSGDPGPEGGGPVIGVQIENEFGHCGASQAPRARGICGAWRRWRGASASPRRCTRPPAGEARRPAASCPSWGATARRPGTSD